MAGDVNYTRLLLGLGLKNFSMESAYLLDVKEILLKTNTKRLNYQVKQILNADNPSKARDLLTKLNERTSESR